MNRYSMSINGNTVVATPDADGHWIKHYDMVKEHEARLTAIEEKIDKIQNRLEPNQKHIALPGSYVL